MRLLTDGFNQTDRFVAISSGKGDLVIPGNAAVVSPDLPFSGLAKFGTQFLSKFQVRLTISEVGYHLSPLYVGVENV
jgi:hypothetical protein